MSAQASSSAPRHAHARALLGPQDFARVASAKLLVVGAGGIGCELLKNLVLVGFKDIEVIDLDTIDLSNLNRQFLFNKSHIKKSKALIASSVAQTFCPSARIQPHHADILRGGPNGGKDGAKFGAAYYAGFDVVLNALDNLEARRHVNKMCIAAGTPLVESGTAGFLGQVQPIMKGITECYDCVPKETPKSYPVCTIRSTPSTPIHCIVWSKSWLFNQLFGEDDETEDVELDKALADGENAKEIDNLRAEAREMRDIRSSLLASPEKVRENALRVFNKVFKADVERLLSMEEMWKNRRRPVPIDFESARTDATEAEREKSGLKDQRLLSLRETVEMFEQSLGALAQRYARDPSEPLSFDKDDDPSLDFVTSSANLRARVYGIEPRTRFQVKQMAGNIIPAIASTNAIIAGALVLQALHALAGRWDQARLVNKTSLPQFIVGSKTTKPNPACGVCQNVYVPFAADPRRVTLGQVIEQVAKGRRMEGGGLGIQGDLEVYEGNRLLADSDFQDNHSKSLAELSIAVGSIISLVDEEGQKANVNLLIETLDLSSVIEGAVPAPWALPPLNKLPDLIDRPIIPEPEPDTEDENDDVTIVDAPLDPERKASGDRKRRADEDLHREASSKRKAAEADGGDQKDGKARRAHDGNSFESAIEL
ncbi:hypothetical protein IE81DRAFT_30274 [Ceraceosorus guamensis]|uniref:Ubiquitin-activating enzyme E1-like n=1 Tax=Ceraceosorus guamensis TaxID=1522189 RepID=A0A316W356_9BASI|nr:hypothetical protein IE81DRAFT_30274 [Ceraceosorus guamensis]PWN44327.1 hypothetical protein IE81DRAFT_30274 [Ceraceosorus guamensis]